MTEFLEYSAFLDALFTEAHRTRSSRDLQHRLANRVRIPCLPIPGFPEFTASGNRFRVPGFCSAIKPRFLLVQRTSDTGEAYPYETTPAGAPQGMMKTNTKQQHPFDLGTRTSSNDLRQPPGPAPAAAAGRDGASNTLLDMSHLLAYLATRVNPKVPQATARAALVEVEGLWDDLLFELKPKLEMRDEFLIAYFYQPVLGCGKEAAHNAELWRQARTAWLSSVGIGSVSSRPGNAKSPFAHHSFTAAVDWSEEDRLINQLARRKPKKGSASLGGAEAYRPPAPQLPAPPKLEELGGLSLPLFADTAAALETTETTAPSWGGLGVDLTSLLAALVSSAGPGEVTPAPAVPTKSISEMDADEFTLELYRQLYPFALPQH